MMNNIYQQLETFLLTASNFGLLNPRDYNYVKNRYYSLLGLKHISLPIEMVSSQNSLAEQADQIIKQLSNHQLQRLGHTHEQQQAEFINTLLPLPSQIEQKFEQIITQENSVEAFNWLFDLSEKSNYIKTAEIAKNVKWITPSKYGNLQITINLSKPEKDPAQIARALVNRQSINYPMCLLCIENEGFDGGNNQPARQNHRMLKLRLNQQDWYFQFSPYSYFSQHSIIINQTHTPMQIDLNTLRVFFDFVDLAPHYIVGSNSDIPIVGGSILTHDHFQAGMHDFPIESAKVRLTYQLATYPHLTIEYLEWPLSTIRIKGSKNDILKVCQIMIDEWYKFSLPELEIIPYSLESIRHNAITPILRKIEEDCYYMYLMLRNNRTTEEYPDGIFHPHQNLHHIKKENIGLIEAMGLAILPGRLAYELDELEKLLLFNDKNLAITELLYDEQLHKHELWLNELYEQYHQFTESNTQSILKTEVGRKFENVLIDCGVFKLNRIGDKGIIQFLDKVNQVSLQQS